MRKLKNFRVKPSTSDIYAVSLVEDEAIESGFITLSKQKQPMNFKIHNEEKRMLYGVALRSNFPIYRCYGQDEFYLTFDANAIERLVNKFMSNYGQKSFTIDHMEPAEGIVITESWLVKDTENDKSNALGLENVSEGSWIIGCKINNDEIWQSIKEGRWHGFSIESWIDMEEIEEFKKIKNKKIENKMAVNKSKFDEMMDQIKSIISDAVQKAEGQDTQVQQDVVDEATDAVEEVVDQKEDTTVVNAAEEQKPAEEEKPTEEVANEVIDTVEQQAETEQDAADNLQQVVDKLQEEIDTLKAENEELKKKNQKMSKKPSTKVVNANAETKQTGIQAAFASLKAQGLINF